MNRCEDIGPWAGRPRAEMMKSDEVEAMLHLHALGWGLKPIAREFGCSKNTVRRYVAADGWMAYSRPVRGGKLDGQEAWLKECFFRHRGNAEVVRQDLQRELSIDVSLRTVERAVAPFRRLLTAEAKATVRLFAALSCRAVQARAAIVVVPRPGRHVPALWRRDEGGADRRMAAARRKVFRVHPHRRRLSRRRFLAHRHACSVYGTRSPPSTPTLSEPRLLPRATIFALNSTSFAV